MFLDTPVYNAHGTVSEVLSACVPVVTLPTDDAHAGRVAASVLINAGFTEGIARTEGDYIELALKLAKCFHCREQLCRLGQSDFMDGAAWGRRLFQFVKTAVDIPSEWSARRRHIVTGDGRP